LQVTTSVIREAVN